MAMRLFQKEKAPLPQGGMGVPLNMLSGPFEADIGCGAGLSAMLRAKAAPEKQILAFEKTRARFQKFQTRLQKEGRPKNLWPLHTNAVWWLAHYGRPGMFCKISFFYPNLFLKARQANLRWIHRPFMPFLLELLEPQGGLLELRSNSSNYVREFKEGLRRFPELQILNEFAVQKGRPPQSDFEKKYMARGETCLGLLAVRQTRSPR